MINPSNVICPFIDLAACGNQEDADDESGHYFACWKSRFANKHTKFASVMLKFSGINLCNRSRFCENAGRHRGRSFHLKKADQPDQLFFEKIISAASIPGECNCPHLNISVQLF